MTWHRTGIPTDAIYSWSTIVIDGLKLLVGSVDGAWFAVEDRCSHAGCPFSTDGEVDGAILICNCHGSEFDIRTGEPTRPPAFEPITTYPTRVVDGRIEVDV